MWPDFGDELLTNERKKNDDEETTEKSMVMCVGDRDFVRMQLQITQ